MPPQATVRFEKMATLRSGRPNPNLAAGDKRKYVRLRRPTMSPALAAVSGSRAIVSLCAEVFRDARGGFPSSGAFFGSYLLENEKRFSIDVAPRGLGDGALLKFVHIFVQQRSSAKEPSGVS